MSVEVVVIWLFLSLSMEETPLVRNLSAESKIFSTQKECLDYKSTVERANEHLSRTVGVNCTRKEITLSSLERGPETVRQHQTR